MTGKEEKQFGGLEIIGVEVKEVIGKGGYRTSKVFQVLYEGSPAYVGKEFRFTAYSSDEREKELVKKCQRWANLQHPNIVRFIGVFKRSSSISSTTLPLLVMEKMNRSLNSLLNHRPKYIAVETKLSILLDVSLGIEYLHHQTPPLVHSNLSSYTILLNTEQRAKISGIEGVQIAPAVEKSQTTSTLFTVIREDVPTQSTDVFSYGSIALQTITQWQPESGSLKEYQQRHGLRSAKSIVEQYQSYLDRVTDDTKHLKGLILSCLHDDAKKRPTISEISRKIKAVAEGKSVFPIIPYSEVNGEKEKVNTLEKSLTSKNNELIFASNQEELKTHQVNEQVTIKKLVSKELEQGYQQEHISPQEIDQIDTTSNGSRQDIAGDQGDLKENKQGNNYLEDTTGNKQEKDNTGGQAEEQINALGFGKRKEENSNTPAANNKPSQADKEATGITSPPSGILPPDDQLLPKVKPTAKGKLPPADEQPTEVKPTAKGKQPPADEQPTEVKSTGKGKLPQTDEQPTEVKPTAEGKLPPADEKPTEVKPTTKGKLPPADEKPTEVKPTTKGKLPPADEKPTEVKPTTKGKQPPADEQPTEVKPTAEGKLPPADEQPTEVKPTGKGKLPPAAEQPTEVKPTGKGKLPAAAEQPTEVKPTGKGKVPPADEPLVGFHRSLPYAFSSDGLGPKVIGYNNLGNTCFFNSMLQSVHQTPRLHYAMAGRKKSYKIPGTEMDNLEVAVSGSVTGQLRNFFSGVSREKNSISPRQLLHSLGRINKRFGRGTQEDSHEVMRSLLSALREEEIHCIKEQIKSYYDGRSRVLPLDGESKLDMKGCLSKASKGVCEVDQLIGTLLVTTTICHSCHNPLEIEELCLDLSLPMPTKASYYHQSAFGNYQQPKQNKMSKKKRKNRKRKKGSGKPVVAQQQESTKTKLNNDDSTPETCEGACGPGEDVEDNNGDDTEFLDSNELLNDDDLPTNRAKFNVYLKIKNLQYSHTFQKSKRDKYSTDLEDCLADFTNLDVLDEDNKFICQKCSTVDGNLEIIERCVSKQMLIHRLPPVLILHMKRFSIGHTVTKDNQHVSFSPVLNMVPFCTTECVQKMADKDKKILYGLYAVVVHGGSLQGGHYTAYVRRRQPFHEQRSTGDSWKYDEKVAYQGEWYYTSDSHVSSRCDFSSVAGSQAYLLFYELLPVV